MDKKVPVECYSRVCGFYRPVNQFNYGKQSEKKERHEYTQEEIKLSLEKLKWYVVVILRILKLV